MEGEILKAAKLHRAEASSQCGVKNDDLVCNMLEEPSVFAACSSGMQRSLVRLRKNISGPTQKAISMLGSNAENHLKPENHLKLENHLNPEQAGQPTRPWHRLLDGRGSRRQDWPVVEAGLGKDRMAAQAQQNALLQLREPC